MIFVYIGCAAAFVISALLACGVIYQHFPTKEYYEIVSGRLRMDRRLILLTDLHGCMHGPDNRKLLRMIREESPDLICIAGDMTVKNRPCQDSVMELMKALCRICPVYYAPGNHEPQMTGYDRYKYELSGSGVHYLENASAPVDGDMIVYGLDLPEYWYHKIWEKREWKKEDMEERLGVCHGDRFSILLAHDPEYAGQYAAWGADLILSGHIHGGIMRLPVLGGVISPSLQLFPKYDAGEFRVQGKTLIVSRGLGLHHIKLRFFNRPEISVIKLTCQKTEK